MQLSNFKPVTSLVGSSMASRCEGNELYVHYIYNNNNIKLSAEIEQSK